MLLGGQPIRNCIVKGKVELPGTRSSRMKIILGNCVVDCFSGSETQFEKPVKLINSHFRNCQFVFSYFIGGLRIENCTFDSYLDFRSGGQNKPESEIVIQNSEFHGFVNFSDCWYQGPVSIIGNRFNRGTNIQSKKQLISFDFAPTIRGNFGLTNIESEGEKNISQ